MGLLSGLRRGRYRVWSRAMKRGPARIARREASYSLAASPRRRNVHFAVFIQAGA